MHPKEFCKFYLESKNIAIVNEEATNSITDQQMQEALKITMSSSGMNPMKLAAYPELMNDIQYALQRSYQIRNIENTYMKKLVHLIRDTKSLSQFIEELIQSKNVEDQKLARRILALSKEVDECAICYTNVSDTFFQCGHRVCKTCSGQLKECRYCRQAILT